MSAQLTLRDVLKKAIQKEVESQLLYTELAQKVSKIATRDLLRDMVRQEQGHQNLLERYLRGELKQGALKPEQTIDYKIAERLDQAIL